VRVRKRKRKKIAVVALPFSILMFMIFIYFMLSIARRFATLCSSSHAFANPRLPSFFEKSGG
jgi:hypothetical protein